MKRKVLLLTLLSVMSVALYAQVPQAITLQSVLRDASGYVVANQNIAVRLTLMQGSATGTPVYIETHMALTNPYGLYSVLFGQGTPVQGDFGGIDWGGGPYYLVVEADPTGGTSYSLSVVQPIVSVPYAIHANTAEHVVQASTATNATHAAHADNAAYADRSQVARHADTAQYYQERQILTMGHDTIYLTGGSFVVLPPTGDVSINNRYIDSLIRQNNVAVMNHYVDSVVNANNIVVEYNFLKHISDSIRMLQEWLRDSVISFHSDSGHACYADTAHYYHERQILTMGHDTIYLTGGSFVVLPAGNGATVSRHYVDSVVNANNAIVENNYLNHISDSVQFVRNTLRDSVMVSLRDSIVSVLRDSAAMVQQTLSTTSDAGCYASCSSVDSLRHINDSLIRAFDSIIHRYDSLIAKLYERVDSIVGSNPANSPYECRETYSRIDKTVCESYTWSLNGQTYTTSTTVSKTLVGANACGNDSIVTLYLTINHGTHSSESRTGETSYTWHGNTYSRSGVYTFSYANEERCPSVDTLLLKIKEELIYEQPEGEIQYCDGIYGPDSDVPVADRCSFSTGALQLNRDHFRLIFKFKAIDYRGTWHLEWTWLPDSEKVQFPLMVGIHFREIGICLHLDGRIYVRINNENDYPTGMTYTPGVNKEINLEFNNGLISINGVNINVGEIRWQPENYYGIDITSTNCASGNAFHGYISSVKVYNIND